MNNRDPQSIVRFNSFEPILFSKDFSSDVSSIASSGHWFTPIRNKDYLFMVEIVDDDTVRLCECDSGPVFSYSTPVPKSSITVVGRSQQMRISSYEVGYEAPMDILTHKFLVAELEAHESMAEDPGTIVCDLYAMLSSLEQMPPDVFAEMLELGADDDIVRIRGEVESNLHRLISDIGGHSLVREIINYS